MVEINNEFHVLLPLSNPVRLQVDIFATLVNFLGTAFDRKCGS